MTTDTAPRPEKVAIVEEITEKLNNSVSVFVTEYRGMSVGALANLGLTVSAQTVGNILKRHGIPPAPERKTTTTWKEFIRTHMDVLVATDFFTAEVWTLGGLVTYYVLFFIHIPTGHGWSRWSAT